MSKKNEKPINKKKKIRTISARRNRVLAVFLSIVLTLTIFLYFAFNLGVPARVLNGATIAGKGIKVTELNYFYNSMLNMYAQFGLIQTADDLQQIANSVKNQTYQDMFQESAAENWQRILLLEQQAKADGFTPLLAEELTNTAIEEIRESVKAADNGMTADQQLEYSYGRGMTVRKAKEIMFREYAMQEYQYSLLLDKYAVSTDQIQETFNADPGAFTMISFHMFEVKAEDPNADDTDTSVADDETASETTAYEPTEEDMKVAVEKAQRIVDAATDAVAFRDAAEIEATGAEQALFAAGSDPTPGQDTKSNIEMYYGEDVAAFLSAPDRKQGDTIVIESETGAYALYFAEFFQNTEETANYRKITLNLGSDAETFPDALEVKLTELMGQVQSEDDFIRLAREKSDNISERYTGGFDISNGLVIGKAKSEFTLTADSIDEETTEEETAPAETQDDEPADGHIHDDTCDHDHEYLSEDDRTYEWLFDEARQAGDMTVIQGDNNNVTLYYFLENVEAWESTVKTMKPQNDLDEWINSLKEDSANGYKINKRLWDFAN